MYRPLKYAFALLFIISECRGMASQRKSKETIVVNSIKPPENLILKKVVNAVTKNSAILTWHRLDNIDSYKVRIYSVLGNVLEQEKIFTTNVANITNLRKNFPYKATVSANYLNAKNITIESGESKPLHFRTKKECDGGQIRSPCNARCVAECDNPDPVCEKICVPGCACPFEKHIWHNGMCIESSSCPAQTGSPHTVTGLHVVKIRNGGTDVILSWDILKGPYMYEIKVRLASNRSVLIKKLETFIPIVRVSGLEPGKLYAFSVQAFLKQSSTARGSALVPPLFYKIKNRRETSFTVTWKSVKYAARYSFTLFNKNKNNILFENGKIAGNAMDIVGLSPGTTYYFSLATAGPSESIGTYSPLTKVVTKGMKNESYIAHGATIVARSKKPTVQVRPNITSFTPHLPCLQKYQSVEGFYKSFPNASTGPKYPTCDKDGLYVVTECKRNDPNACWCVEPVFGKKSKGSEFGGTNAKYPLDCNKYGKLLIPSLNPRVNDTTTHTIKIEWNSNRRAVSYVVVIRNLITNYDDKTVTVPSDRNSYTIDNLETGNGYNIGLYLVSRSGATNPIQDIVASTSFNNPPDSLEVLSKTANNLTIKWSMDHNAELYKVVLIKKKMKSEVVVETIDVRDNKVTFTKLKNYATYIIEIRVETRQYTGHYGEKDNDYIVHVSDPASIEVSIRCDLPPVDIIFSFDSSQSATFKGLESSKALAAATLKQLPLIDGKNPKGTRVAAVRYFRRVQTIFNYNRFKKTSNAFGALRYIRYTGDSKTRLTNYMLGYIYRKFFVRATSSYKKRKNSLSISIIFYFGNRRFDATPLKQLSKKTNVIVIWVTKSKFPQNKLIEYFGKNVIVANSLTSLESMSDTVMKNICKIAKGK